MTSFHINMERVESDTKNSATFLSWLLSPDLIYKFVYRLKSLNVDLNV